MNPEKQRLAIAKAMGLKRQLELHRSGQPYEIPLYLTDLNSMHEAEILLQDKCKYWPDYIEELSRMFPSSQGYREATPRSQMCHATATQRAEAFLRTLGLWEASEEQSTAQAKDPVWCMEKDHKYRNSEFNVCSRCGGAERYNRSKQ